MGRPKAFVIRAAAAQVDEAELIGYLKTHIAHFKVAGSIAFVDELPSTSTGKTMSAKG